MGYCRNLVNWRLREEGMAELETAVIRPYKYKLEQTSKGTGVTVHGDTIDEVIVDYTTLRVRLQQEGFRIAPEE